MEQLTILTSFCLPEHLQANWMLLESWYTSTSDFYLFVFLFIIYHKDILLISFINNHICSFIMNVYSDSSYSALKYLKNTEANVSNMLIMTGNFNIRDSL